MVLAETCCMSYWSELTAYLKLAGWSLPLRIIFSFKPSGLSWYCKSVEVKALVYKIWSPCLEGTADLLTCLMPIKKGRLPLRPMLMGLLRSPGMDISSSWFWKSRVEKVLELATVGAVSSDKSGTAGELKIASTHRLLIKAVGESSDWFP